MSPSPSIAVPDLSCPMQFDSLEPSNTLNIMWMEDLLTGDYVPWVHPDAYRELTTSTTIPIHTGEQIYLRHNFRDLIQTKSVRDRRTGSGRCRWNRGAQVGRRVRRYVRRA